MSSIWPDPNDEADTVDVADDELAPTGSFAELRPTERFDREDEDPDRTQSDPLHQAWNWLAATNLRTTLAGALAVAVVALAVIVLR